MIRWLVALPVAIVAGWLGLYLFVLLNTIGFRSAGFEAGDLVGRVGIRLFSGAGAGFAFVQIGARVASNSLRVAGAVFGGVAGMAALVRGVFLVAEGKYLPAVVTGGAILGAALAASFLSTAHRDALQGEQLEP